MTEYLVYKCERFRPEGGSHTSNQVKYWCENLTGNKISDNPPQYIATHPLTDDNPHRLFGQIASMYEIGDKIRTVPNSEINTSSDGKEVELTEPLSHDELRILSVQILEALGNKKAI